MKPFRDSSETCMYKRWSDYNGGPQKDQTLKPMLHYIWFERQTSLSCWPLIIDFTEYCLDKLFLAFFMQLWRRNHLEVVMSISCMILQQELNMYRSIKAPNVIEAYSNHLNSIKPYKKTYGGKRKLLLVSTQKEKINCCWNLHLDILQ